MKIKETKKTPTFRYGIEITKPHSKEMYDHNDKVASDMKRNILSEIHLSYSQAMGDIAANLLRYGVTLGISSRGVGSLKKEGGQNLVQDDFELICFDLVSSPSTPGAYLFKDLNDKSLYDESLEEKEKTNDITKTLNPSLRLMNKLDGYLN